MKYILILFLSSSFFVQSQNFTFIEKEPDKHKLYSQMQKYLKTSRSEDFGTEVFFENLRNKQLNLNDNSSFDISWWLNLIISYNYPIENLTEFGITSNGDGSYNVNIKDYPEWIQTSTLLAGLDNSKHINSISPKLITRGVNSSAIEKIKKYAEENNRAASSLESHLSFFKKNIGDFNKRFKDSQYNNDEKNIWLLSFNYSVSKIQNRTNKQWSKGLLNQLTKKEQRILIHYLRENLGSIMIYPDDVQSYIIKLDDLFTSGRYETEILNSLAINKEKGHE